MHYGGLDDLLAFLAVARERSFTKAAGKLGISQSALSHTIRRLEERMELRLLARTTRSVSLTKIGEQLFYAVGSRLDNVVAELEMLQALRDRPAGTVRITASDYAISCVRPNLAEFLAKYPDIKVEFSADYALVDIVEQRFDGGIRLGESLSQDMVAVRVGPDIRFAVIGAPAYFDRMPEPLTPHDLTGHNCINLRLPTAGGLNAWKFEKDGKAIDLRVEGQLTFNSVYAILDAAVDGCGLGFVPEEIARDHIREGRLRTVLADWCPAVDGFYLYYPNRRHPSPAFKLLVEALRHRD